MNETIFMEVSDILETFDIDEISKMIDEQINDDYETDIYTEILTDHLKPLYYNYAKLAKYNLDEDLREKAETKFISICIAFLQAILKKFSLEIDKEWITNNYENIPAITMAFYTFFVLDFTTNAYEILVNYINTNGKEVIKTFDGLKIKKDASSLSNKKNLSSEMALVISNIYDISEWIFDNLDEEDYFTYLDNSYVPLKLISSLYKGGYLSGNFANIIYQIFHCNISLKSSLCFKYIYQVKNGEIEDKFVKDTKDESARE